MGRLDGKVAIITGGARGQGASEGILFAQEGAKVVLGDILDEEGASVEAQIREAGGDARYVRLDVTLAADWERAVELAESAYGKLDVLVNNAAIFMPNGIEDTTEEQWDRLMAINAKGVFLGTKHSIPAMRRAGGGSIINISSIAGMVGNPRSGVAYSASKGAVRLFTKATAIQHAKDNIRCNSVHPGPIDTPMTEESRRDPAQQAQRLARVPMGRSAAPEEVAYGVLFLASDESSYMTGSEMVIDGGVTAQ